MSKASYFQPMKESEVLHSTSYEKVGRRVFRQLFEALIYEEIVHAERREIAGSIRYSFKGMDENKRMVTYECYGRRRASFGRIRLHEPIMRVMEGSAHEAESLSQCIVELFHNSSVSETNLTAFSQELEQTRLKDSCSQSLRSTHDARLQTLNYDRLESLLMDGHPYHPCYKSRIGFDLTDNYAYGPEFEPDIAPVWVALREDIASVHMAQGLDYRDHLLSELGEAVLQRFDHFLHEQGLIPEAYVYMPIHPWQWQRHVQETFLSEIKDRRIVQLGVHADQYRPQQSIRTLANQTNPQKPYLKLSMHIRNTSSMRFLRPHSIAGAPLISRWLKDMVQGDSYLRDEARVVILAEFAGVYGEPHDSAERRLDTYGAIGAIWRESVHRYLEPGEEAVPFNALTAIEANGTPFIDSWIGQYGLTNWLELVLKACMLPVVHFLTAHGFAMESHAQNMILIHKHGIPQRVALKDFHEGVEYFPPFLKERERCPDFGAVHPYYKSASVNEAYEMDSLPLVRELMTDCLFFMNLGELALTLAEHYDFEETIFWDLVYSLLERYRRDFPELEHRFAELDLYAPAWRVEQLTRRRLYPERELMVKEAPNPLYLAMMASSRNEWEVGS